LAIFAACCVIPVVRKSFYSIDQASPQSKALAAVLDIQGRGVAEATTLMRGLMMRLSLRLKRLAHSAKLQC
jgi:hypothetical protein